MYTPATTLEVVNAGAKLKVTKLREEKRCDPSGHLQESPGRPGPKSQKSLKKSLFGGLQKVPENTRKSQKNTQT